MILFYPHNDSDGKRLEEEITKIIKKETLIVIHELGILLRYLKRRDIKHRVLVFLVTTENQLLQLVEQVEELNNLKKILVLPNSSSEMMKVACALYPTYMTSVHGDFGDARDVLLKLKTRFTTL